MSDDIAIEGGAPGRTGGDDREERSPGPADPAELGVIEARLIARFCPPLRPEHVRRRLAGAVDRFDGARIRTYLPLLIERAATDQLRAELHHPSVTMNGSTPDLAAPRVVSAAAPHPAVESVRRSAAVSAAVAAIGINRSGR